MTYISKPLLEHPFYQAWNDGEVTVEQLSEYGEAYQTFMDRVPEYWQKVIDGLGLENGDEIVAEETEHAELWDEWNSQLPDPEEAPKLEALFEKLEGMSPLQLAGALHAYEVQQPDVAKTKKKGLVEFYGFDTDELKFFDEHIEEEDEHIAFGEYIQEKFDEDGQFDEGFEKGAEAIYHSLDAFCRVEQPA